MCARYIYEYVYEEKAEEEENRPGRTYGRLTDL